jgi:hypothetical protein
MSIVRFGGRALGESSVTPRRRRVARADLTCEPLEQRKLLSGDSSATSLSQITAGTNLDVISAVSTGPTGLTPAEIREAYGINLISFSSGTITGDGAGETIAIVDAYDDPDIATDLAIFDREYGLAAPPSFTIDNLGATTTDAGWALETSLDVEWAHAIAPAANLILVEAATSNLANLFSAVGFAGKQAGVTVVSMSWGTAEFRGESTYNGEFTTAAGHANVTYVAASGDSAAYSGPEYPSVSPDVLAVGGTTLTLTASGSYGSESAWSDSTGGFSGTDSNFRSYESEPSFQTSTLESVGLSGGVRTTPDVSFNADPRSGVSVYDSVAYNGQSGWFDLGGTSAAAPAWAGLIAIADQGMATAGKDSLTTTEALTDLYALPSTDFNDITAGSNGYNATTGYDLVTGLGTPRSDQVISGLLAANGVSESTTTTTSAQTTTAAASPRNPSDKHTKVVVKKIRKVARKAKVKLDAIDGSTGSDTPTTQSIPSDSTSKSASSSNSSTPGLQATAVTQTDAQTVTTFFFNASSLAIRAVGGQQALATDTSGTSSAPVNQSLEPERLPSRDHEIAKESPGGALSHIVVNPHPVSNSKEKDPMTRPAVVTYEPAFAQPLPVPFLALLSPADDEFDRALEQVASSQKTRRGKPVGPRDRDQEDKPQASAPSVVSTLIGAGALAGAGYRLVLRAPDDPKSRPAWYSRFPTS